MHKKITTGIYMRGNALHVDIPEILAAYNLEDTEGNRDMCAEIAEKACRDAGLLTPAAKSQHVHAHRCPRCDNKWSHDGKRVRCPLPKNEICGRCNS
jgi:hypothetical protein